MTKELIEQMRRHVASYKTLSPHRQRCLDLCDALEQMQADKDFLHEKYDAEIQNSSSLQQRIEELEGKCEVFKETIAAREATIAERNRDNERLRGVYEAADRFMRGFPHFYASDASELLQALAAVQESDDGASSSD